ncbi:MAG: hypothetical protein KF817_15760 [Phycisphaeraceae bacterium]|nr:hypothetical protein [Phycisphaeraceae bacterium]
MLNQVSAGLVLALALSGCAPRLASPTRLQSPWSDGVVWGIAPMVDESGTTAADLLRLSDALQRAAQEIDGVDAVPVNRVLAAMRELGMDRIRTAQDAQALLRRLDLDGLIVSTLSAYDPYRPPVLGLMVELHTRDDLQARSTLDMRQVERSPREIAPGGLGARGPAASAARVFEAHNHAVLMELDGYAKGRNAPDTAFGAEVYLVSMDLYAQFAAHALFGQLLDQERRRLAVAAVPDHPR